MEWLTQLSLMNSRPTHQIDSKNRVMADAWNCQKRYVTVNPQIGGETESL
jgi:hypothetical protein